MTEPAENGALPSAAEAAPETAQDVPASDEKETPAPAAEQTASGPSAEKLKAIEELKAAIRAAANKPKPKRKETEELVLFCQCVKSLAGGSEIFSQIKDILPRIGENHLGPLMGIKRPAPRPVVQKPSAPPVATANRVIGRVKSYNTRKGFGFITVPDFPRDIFVYNSHLIGRIGLLAGETVSFDLVVEGGRPQARNVKVLGGDNVAQDMFGQNALGDVKKALAEPREPMGQSVLGMAAAAVEVPTTLPEKRPKEPTRSPEELLQEQIRKAQSEATTRKNAPIVKQPPAVSFGIQQDSRVPVNEGNFPKGSTVRIVGFPSPDVDGCTGTVTGFDPPTSRYGVDVETRDGEFQHMSLREEYLQLEDKAGASSKAAPPPLPGGSSQGLQKSAADALRKFGHLAPQQGTNNWQMNRDGGGQQRQPMQNMQMAAAGALGAMGGAGQLRLDSMMGGGGMSYANNAGMQGNRNQMDAMRGANKLPQAGPNQQMQQMGMQAPRQGPVMNQAMQEEQMRQQQQMNLAAQQREIVEMQRREQQQRELQQQREREMAQQRELQQQREREMQQRQAQQQQQQAQAKAQQEAIAAAQAEQLARQARQPVIQPPQPKQAPAQRAGPPPGSGAPEGRPGQVWVVLKSPHFNDVIVRASQEVTSRELRRLLPGEALTQRDMTVTLANGLVRMPVEPDGWVTVHARHINGPTFLSEAANEGPPARGPGRGGGGMREALSQTMPPPPPPSKVPDYIRHTYPREELLRYRDQPQQAPMEMRGFRALIVPNLGGKTGRRESKNRDRDRDQHEDDDGEGRPSRSSAAQPPPAREREAPAPARQPSKEPEEKKTGEDKKQECPTQ